MTKKLVADIGGTTIRAAVASVEGDTVRLEQVRTTRIDGCSDLANWLRDLIETGPEGPASSMQQAAPEIASCGLAVAGPLREMEGDQQVSMTNFGLSLSAAELSARLGMPVTLFNDFSALSLGVPHLGAADLLSVHEGASGLLSSPSAARAVIGPGTGLGVSGLLPHSSGYAVIAGEGGHAGLAIGSEALEQAVWGRLRAEIGFVSAEDVLCGTHLPRLHRMVCEELGQVTQTLTDAADIAHAAFVDADASARATLDLFTLWLGRVAGDVALMLGARAGVFLAGGILPRWQEAGGFDHRRFMQGFLDKATFAEYLTAVPVHLVLHPYPALLGLATHHGALA